jgi:uncharacterized protein YegL
MKTHTVVVLDSSGSMESIKDDTIGGFNSFLDDQRDEPGEATLTVYEFASTVDCLFQGRPIEEAPRLDAERYSPGGRTALYDAIATASVTAKDRIREHPASEKPDHVVVVVLTDGKENASETSHERVRELIEQRQAEHDWEYLFIGANQEAALTAASMGMDEDRSLNMDHSGEGTRAAYDSVSENLSEARRTGATGGFDQKDRRRQEEAQRDD